MSAVPLHSSLPSPGVTGNASPVPAMSVIIPALNEEKLLPGILMQFTPELRQKHCLEIIVSESVVRSILPDLKKAGATGIVVRPTR